jgi:hypothetical protein
MTKFEFEQENLQINAAIIAESFGIEPSTIQARMREGKITSTCERGINADAGRYRLTFFYESQRLRLIVDNEGHILRRSVIDFGDRPLPASMRKPGA